jgi:hypothetical protein
VHNVKGWQNLRGASSGAFKHKHEHVVCLWIFPYLEELWNLKISTLPKKHKIEIPLVVTKQFKVSVNENQMPLEDKNAI